MYKKIDYICPFTKEKLKLSSHNGELHLKSSKFCYPIINEIPRFVNKDNYAKDFGFQWNKFRKTQLDSFSGLSISEDRLSRVLGIPLEKLKGLRVLEVGCGSGRFTEILLKYKANVISFDMSLAVEANKQNNPLAAICQADINNMPFKKDFFDVVLCIGVLQHTPSPEKSLGKIIEVLKPKGLLAIDHYRRKFRNILPPPLGVATFLYRPAILSLPNKKRYKTVKKIFDFWFPIHWKFKENIFLQKILRRVSPVHFYYHSLNLKDKGMYYDWGLLDTHDSLTDTYKHHRNIKQINDCLVSNSCGNINLYINPMDGVEGTARKK